jgi:hypothetical protein
MLIVAILSLVAVVALTAVNVRLRTTNRTAEAARAELEGKWATCETRASELEADRTAAETRASELRQRIVDLEAANARLARWETVADADATAAEILRDARAAAEAAAREALRIRGEARQEAERVVAEARAQARTESDAAKQQAQRVVLQADERLRAATAQAAAIVQQANAKAEQIAGDALKALNNAEHYDRTAKALRNIIQGYGDAYVVPGQSLLDDLADDVSHTDAGQQLKLVRDRVRAAVRGGTAATCDYVEANRRETAIRFVIDAFNGKADSILARVRHDNAGTLQQELRDAFAMVNHNGQAFKNARIAPEYLDLRLDELRWAAVSNEIKLQEREEQRRIKEQIREEEKARREYERAIREASKEEDMLRKAMEKAEQQMAKANAEQRTMFEAQLQELAERLKEAEARGQRALSMAQQTKRGHVYVISNVGSFGEHVYKIGLTRRLDPLERIRELGDSSVPFEFDVHALIFSDDAPGLENRLHKHFVISQMNKVNHRKEFFRVNLAHVRTEIETLGLDAHWTMTAAAREYRETLAIEKAMEENPAQREAWINRQLTLEPVGFDETEDAEAGGLRGVAVPGTGADALVLASPA